MVRIQSGQNRGYSKAGPPWVAELESSVVIWSQPTTTVILRRERSEPRRMGHGPHSPFEARKSLAHLRR